MMNYEPQTVEVEVLAIDGVTPVTRSAQDRTSAPGPPWQQDIRSRILRLDSRWWPLWVVLGAIAVFLLLTVGVVVGVVYVGFRILSGIIRAIIR